MRYRSPRGTSFMRPVRLQNLPFRLSWRLRRWAATRSAAPWIAGGLERPDRQQRYSRSVDVRGWVSAPADRPVAVDVRLGDTTLRRLALTPAPGAPAPAGHVRSTFDAVIPLEPCAVAGVAADRGVRRGPRSASRVLGITQLVRARPGDKLPQRAAYGAVWDAVATTLSDAQFSVAGTTDPAALARKRPQHRRRRGARDRHPRDGYRARDRLRRRPRRRQPGPRVRGGSAPTSRPRCCATRAPRSPGRPTCRSCT